MRDGVNQGSAQCGASVGPASARRSIASTTCALVRSSSVLIQVSSSLVTRISHSSTLISVANPLPDGAHRLGRFAELSTRDRCPNESILPIHARLFRVHRRFAFHACQASGHASKAWAQRPALRGSHHRQHHADARPEGHELGGLLARPPRPLARRLTQRIVRSAPVIGHRLPRRARTPWSWRCRSCT